jgi:hypothetical protein
MVQWGKNGTFFGPLLRLHECERSEALARLKICGDQINEDKIIHRRARPRRETVGSRCKDITSEERAEQREGKCQGIKMKFNGWPAWRREKYSRSSHRGRLNRATSTITPESVVIRLCCLTTRKVRLGLHCRQWRWHGRPGGPFGTLSSAELRVHLLHYRAR